MKDEDQEIVNFFYEVGQLKREPRSGWQLLGIKQPESVAEHTCRAVFIAYVLAKMEGCNPEKASLIAAFHELPETRLGDLHKVAQNYCPEKKSIELRILKDQLSGLPDDIKKGFEELLLEFERDTTPEQIVARDADFLEVLLQAKEYLKQGYGGAQNWIENAKRYLKTKTAKKWASLIEKTSVAWYEDLKRIKR